MVDRIIVRRAAAQRITNYAESLTDESENDSPHGKEKGTATIKYPGSAKASLKLKASSTRPLRASFVEKPTSISAPILTPTTRPRPRPIFNRKKDAGPEPEPEAPKLTFPVTDGESSGSDLTPLTSPIDSKQETQPSLPNLQTPQASGSQKRRAAPSPSASKLPWGLTRNEAWSRTSLGTYVWVLLDNRARVFDPEDTTGRSRERLWWPGQIEHSLPMSPINVRLFGNASLGVRNIEIQQPSQLNIQSLNDPLHRPRFDSPTFVVPSDFDGNDLHESPRKKQKRDRGDLEERWSIAVANMVQNKADEEESSDDLPEVGTLEFKYIPSSPTKSTKETLCGNQKGREQRKYESISDDESYAHYEYGDIHVDRWSPPLADDTLTIPGELVLAREKRHNTTYWPARILKYVPPKKRSQEPKYVVEFLDGLELAIPRDIFYTTDEDSFATCEMGEWKSEFQDVLNDDEAAISTDQDSRERSPSPLPCNPPPSSTDFTHFGIRQQFVYTKPVLQAILNEGYPPARRRHDKFILGGQARQAVVDEAGLRGKMDPKHVAELQEYLIAWCLRDERRGDFISDEGDRVKGEGSTISDTPSVPDRTAQDVVDHPDAPPKTFTQSPSPSHSTTDVSSMSSPKGVSPLSTYCSTEDIEALPLSLPSTSSSNIDSPRTTPTQSIVDIDLTLDDVVDSISTQESESRSEPPRQRGCDAFEMLSRREKNDYCLNVLLPEAILQVLLWRAGLRTSVELLSESEERKLHDQGDVLINESDWVYDVIRLRMSKIRQLRRTHSMSQGSSVLGPLSVTGRPRRNVGVPKSYQE